MIVATWRPNETIILETIRELGLELQIVFNKGAVMVLPTGVNKATGLAAALDEIGLSPHNVVAIGDAENDHAFFGLCGCSAAVANALPMVKETADLVTIKGQGAGVAELIDELTTDDLAGVERLIHRRRVVLAVDKNGGIIPLPRRDANIVLAGTSGGGKSTLTAGLLERLHEQSYQFCVIDPEGDYEAVEGAIVIGDSSQPPVAAKILELLERPDRSAIVNLLGIGISDRPRFLAELLPSLQQLRSRTARPHWIFIDEAHHMLPTEWQAGGELAIPSGGVFLITVHPDKLAAAALSAIDILIVLGQSVDETVASFSSKVDWPDLVPPLPLQQGQAWLFARKSGGTPQLLRVVAPKSERQRHIRKYAEGKLGEDKSFYFRGADGRLNLRAHNLELFLQMADGVDEETWLHHLRAGDYSRWFREAIKDNDLAEVAASIEAQADLDPSESRARIRKAVQGRYTSSA